MAYVSESEIKDLERQLSRIRDENYQLEREIGKLNDSITRSADDAASAGNHAVDTLTNGTRVIEQDDHTLHDVEKIRADIEARFKLYKNIESAYKTIRGLQEEMRSQQGFEQKVRRMVIAILDNEDKGLVSEATLIEQAEKLYTDANAQKFFLTYIMMDLIHRKEGRTEAADRARAQAIERDKRMSQWVYFLIALKRGEAQEESFWLDALMERALMGTERENLKFLTLLALEGNDEISKKVAKYIGIENIGPMDRKEITEDILRRYRQAMTVETPEFKYLKQYVAEYEDLREALRGAMNNETVGGYIQKVSKADGEELRRGVIGMVLDRVIDDCRSPRSQEILKEIAKNQNIITAKGDLVQAQALEVKEKSVSVSDLKLENCLYEWLVEKGNYNGKKELVGFAYGKLKPSYVHAYHDYLSGYRRKNHGTLSVDVGGYSVQTSLSSAAEEAVTVERTCRKHYEERKNAIKNTASTVMMILGAILVVAGILLYYVLPVSQTVKTLANVFGVLLGIVLLLVGVVKRFRNYRARIDLDRKCEEDIVTYTELMQYVVSDMAAYRAMFREADGKALKDSFFD